MKITEAWTHDSSIQIRTTRTSPGERGMFANLRLFSDFMRQFESIGFAVDKEPEIELKYPSLSPFNRILSKQTSQGTLFISAKHFESGMEFEGWQNVAFSNPNGGRYDFNKMAKMPYLIRLTFLKFMNVTSKLLECHGVKFNDTKPSYHEDPLGAFNGSWGADRFNRDSSGWPCESELSRWRRDDFDGVRINQGELRHVIYGGRWIRVRVYGGINGMWTGVSGVGITCQNASSLHSSVQIDELRRRQVDNGRKVARICQDFVTAVNDGNFAKASVIRRLMQSSGITVPAVAIATQ